MPVAGRQDRLSRDVHLISGLMVHRVSFIVAGLGSILADWHVIPASPSRTFPPGNVLLEFHHSLLDSLGLGGGLDRVNPCLSRGKLVDAPARRLWRLRGPLGDVSL
jgi:hypothetical protein